MIQRFISKLEWAQFKYGATKNLTFYRAAQLHYVFGDNPWEHSFLIEIPDPVEYRANSEGYAEKVS